MEAGGLNCLEGVNSMEILIVFWKAAGARVCAVRMSGPMPMASVAEL